MSSLHLRAALLLSTLLGLGACGDESDDEATLLLEHLPIDLGAINYATVLAQRDNWDAGVHYPITDFGYVMQLQETTKTNPQPTFWVPLETKVLAPVSGKIARISELYSGDFSIHIGKGDAIWELEHVVNLQVSEGDVVEAGQELADVSYYECEYAREEFGNEGLCDTGIGLIELGLLIPGDTEARHRCPFDPEVVAKDARATVFAELDAARAVIEEELEDPDYFDEASYDTAYCVSLDLVDG